MKQTNNIRERILEGQEIQKQVVRWRLKSKSIAFTNGVFDILHEGHILSTEGMMERAKNSPKTDFIVATETGILYRMQKENPSKNFIPIKKDAICQYMKKITIDKVYNSLLNNVYQVRVPKSTADKARYAIERMLSIG